MAKKNSQEHIIDPCLGKVLALKKSDYIIDDKEPTDVTISKQLNMKKNLYLDHNNRGIFLGLHKDRNMMIYLTVRPENIELQGGNNDLFMITTYINIIDENSSTYIGVEKNNFAISPMPKNIRQMIPILDVAYKLEERLQNNLSKSIR